MVIEVQQCHPRVPLKSFLEVRYNALPEFSEAGATESTARRTINGYEIMNMIRKGQIQGVVKDAVTDRVKFIAEIFGVAA